MELIDWGAVLAVTVAGAVLVGAAWLLIPLAYFWLSGSGRSVRRTTRRTAKHERPAEPADVLTDRDELPGSGGS
jgi:hypothetical protein